MIAHLITAESTEVMHQEIPIKEKENKRKQIIINLAEEIEEFIHVEEEELETNIVDVVISNIDSSLFYTDSSSYLKWITTEGNRRYNRVHTPPLYCDSPKDNGNYNSKGEITGTMMSISSPAWESYTGKIPTAKDMKNITREEAYEFYKEKIWDKINADSIKSQKIAEIICDMKSSAGGYSIIKLRKVAKMPRGVSMTSQLLKFINDQDPIKLYRAYRKEMLHYYSKEATPKYFRKAWVRDLNRYYPEI
jgi:hypothetical protein